MAITRRSPKYNKDNSKVIKCTWLVDRTKTYVNSDYDGKELEFNDDGECIGDDTWDYPGSPYLSEDDNIY